MPTFRPWADVQADAEKAGASPEQIEAWRKKYNEVAPQYMAPLAPEPEAPKEDKAPEDEEPPIDPETADIFQLEEPALNLVSKAYRTIKQPFEQRGQAITKRLSQRDIVSPVRKAATRAAYGLHEAGLPVTKEQAHAAGRAAEHIARQYGAPAVGGAFEYAPEMAATAAFAPLEAAAGLGPLFAAAKAIPYVGWLPEAAVVGGGIGMAKRAAQGRTKEVDPTTGQVIPPATPEDLVRSSRQGAAGFIKSEAAARALGFALGFPFKAAGVDWFEGAKNRPETEGHGSKAGSTPPVEEKPAATDDDDDDGGGGGERGASGGSEVNTKKEASDPGLAARNERTDKPGSGAGGTDPDDDGGGGGGGKPTTGGPTSRTVPPAVAPEATENEAVPSQPTGPGSSDQQAMPDTGEPKPRTQPTEPETPESRRRGIEIAEAEYRWRERQRQEAEGPPAEPLSPYKPGGPVRDYFKQVDEEARRQAADELNRQHTVTIGEEPPEPRNTIEYYRRLRGLPDVEGEPASRYEGLPRNVMEAGREDRPYQPPQPTGPVILPTQEQAGGGAFNRLMAQLRGEREPGGPGIPDPAAEARRAEIEQQRQTLQQQAAERALRDARLDEEARRLEQERAYERTEAGKRFVRKMTRGFGREEPPGEPLRGPILEPEPPEPEAREPEPPEPSEADKEAEDRAKRAAAALRHAREAEAEEPEPEEPEKPKEPPAPMTKARMLGIVQQLLAAMKEEHDRAGASPYWKSLRKSLRNAQKELDRLDREEREGGGGRPKPAAPGGQPGRGEAKGVVVPPPDQPPPGTPGAAGPAGGAAPTGGEKVEDEVPPPTDPEGKGPGHAPIVGSEDELHVEGFPPVRFRYEVVEARNVVASHNADFTPDPRAVPDLQGRNRDRAAMIAQVRKIRSKMNPPLLFDAPSAVQGAPLVGMDWNTEGGNGRVIAVKGLEKGNAQYRRYIDDLKARLPRFGIPPEQAAEIENFDQPLLIRRRLSHLADADRARFADATNADPGAHLSAGEKALADARRLTPDMLEHLTLSERGTLNTDANLPFIRQFLASLTEADANDHSTKEGYLNDAGLRRLQNAVITRAYVLGRDLHPALDRMFESTDADVKTIQNGLLRAAPHFAAYRGLVDSGELPFVDVMTPLLDAASTVSNLRNDGLVIRDWFDQGSLMPRPHALERAMVLYRDHTAVPDLHDALTDVANVLLNLKRKSAGDLFGEEPTPPTPEQVFDLARDPRQARMDEEDEVRSERAEKQLNAEIATARANGEYDKVERLEAERKLLRDRKKPCP